MTAKGASALEENRMIGQTDLFPVEHPSPAEVIRRAVERYRPVRTYSLLSGGDGSLQATHYYMNNVPGCEVAHIATGVGLKITEQFVRDTCKRFGWRLTVIRSKEDCGQDYDQIVLKHGFPGPASHRFMYIQLKERAIEELVRRSKRKGSREKVMLLTGIKHDDSQRRSGYGGGEITVNKAQVWVNALYWADKSAAHQYLIDHGIPRNPVSMELGMSGECGCGAFASKGELALWRRIERDFGERIDRLQAECRMAGVHWNWEDRPPRDRDDTDTLDMFSPMCVHCLKSERRAA